MLRENWAQRVFEHGIFKEYARQWGEPDAGADGVRDRDRHRSEAKYNAYRNLDVAVRGCEGCALKRNEFSGLRWPPWQSLASSHVSSLAWAGGNTHCEA